MAHASNQHFLQEGQIKNLICLESGRIYLSKSFTWVVMDIINQSNTNKIMLNTPYIKLWRGVRKMIVVPYAILPQGLIWKVKNKYKFGWSCFK